MTGSADAITLVPLCTATYRLAEPIRFAPGQNRIRVIGEIETARFEGERLRGSLEGRAAADWATVDFDGTIRADVRLTIRTDDDAVILVQYVGRGNRATGVTISVPLFETDDERYQWLSSIVTIARGVHRGDEMRYEIFEVA